MTYAEIDKKLTISKLLDSRVKKNGFEYYSEALESMYHDITKKKSEVIVILGITTAKMYEDLETLKILGIKITSREKSHGESYKRCLRRFELKEALEGVRGW